MERITNFLKSLGKWPSILLLLATFFGINAFFFPWAEKKLAGFGGPGTKVLDLHFGFSPEEAYRFLEKIGPEGRSLYGLIEGTADMIYPIVYSLLLGTLLVLIWRRILPENSRRLRIGLIPLVAAVFDYLENICNLILVQRFPQASDAVAQASSLMGMGKWVFFGLSALLLVAGLVIWGVKALSTRK
ncbi:MAG: hypothetical protein IPH04_20945 [Saprospirales bacterium]|nr:hypothetical protein [Saprospirales bacterium]